MTRTIELIAEGVIINSRILEKLLDQLPKEAQQAVATIVAPVVPVTAEPKLAEIVPGTTAPAPVPNIVPPFVESAPVAPVAPVPNIVPPFVEPAPVAPVASLFVEPAPVAPAAPVVPAAPAPFDNASGMVSYVVDSYRVLGAKGSEIQTVLNDLGYVNINEVKSEHYSALYNAIEALKK